MHVEIKLKGPFVFYLHNLGQRACARCCITYYTSSISPLWLFSPQSVAETSIIRGPMMENNVCFLSFECVSLASAPAWGIKAGDGRCQRDWQGQGTPLRKKFVAGSVASVQRRHVQNRHMVLPYISTASTWCRVQGAPAHVLYFYNNL